MEGPILHVERLTKNFGGLAALSQVTLEIQRGEVVGIIGPNGAGKTTLFNLISGFLRPDSGNIVFRGESIAHKKPQEIVARGIARTFQIPRPFHNLKVVENVAVPLIVTKRRKGSGVSKLEIAHALLERVGLGGKKFMKAGDLSEGDLKRLELAKALATEPELVLLDEPFSGLSSTEIEGLVPLIRELSEQGTTVLIVEHKLRELMKLVRRVVVLNFGQKIADGRPEEIAADKVVIEAYLGAGGAALVLS
jgi:branched-chain amino acid transport system ATP-binding protein